MSGLDEQVDQVQNIIMVQGEVGDFSDTHNRVKRADSSENNSTVIEDKISSVFNLNNSHLHLMVHWAGKGYSIVFCLARDQVGREGLLLIIFANYQNTSCPGDC